MSVSPRGAGGDTRRSRSPVAVVPGASRSTTPTATPAAAAALMSPAPPAVAATITPSPTTPAATATTATISAAAAASAAVSDHLPPAGQPAVNSLQLSPVHDQTGAQLQQLQPQQSHPQQQKLQEFSLVDIHAPVTQVAGSPQLHSSGLYVAVRI